MTNEAPTQYHKWLRDDTIKVKLMKMSKGYQWEITAEAVDDEAVIHRIKDTDEKLRQIYTPIGEENEVS